MADHRVIGVIYAAVESMLMYISGHQWTLVADDRHY